MYTIHHNEKDFPESFKFRPERWLNEEQSPEGLSEYHTTKEGFSPFGVGSRSCAGKAMAYWKPV